MKLHPIAVAIPVFFAAIGLEALWARRRRVSVYRFADTITDLSCGLGNQAVALVFSLLLLSAYGAVYERFTLVRFPPGSVWPWVIAFVGVDFLYYWWHRFSHEVNVLWAVHVVHHQSEDYNLAVALRQPYFTSFTIFPFYLLLAFVGVPPLVYAINAALSLLYQFWIHTELVDRLPAPLEAVLNTPSHHRVHHGTNPEYLDKNYGAVLIVWDRLFGTFEPERAGVVYGTTVPIGSFNPLWANVEYFAQMRGLARQGRGLSAWAWAIVGHPARDPKTGTMQVGKPVDREKVQKFEVSPASAWVRGWIIVQMGLAAVALILLLLTLEELGLARLAIAAGLIFFATVAWGGLLERRRWAWPLEAARVAASLGVAGWLVLALTLNK